MKIFQSLTTKHSVLYRETIGKLVSEIINRHSEDSKIWQSQEKSSILMIAIRIAQDYIESIWYSEAFETSIDSYILLLKSVL